MDKTAGNTCGFNSIFNLRRAESKWRGEFVKAHEVNVMDVTTLLDFPRLHSIT